ncbi:hypothetical protein [Chitinimonas koreensis]|nr:hypothetical protein [Chitinimonas koreensis]QNM95528.1 hypothetical protein H9L41_16880 [Chitinimonas koreensis]
MNNLELILVQSSEVTQITNQIRQFETMIANLKQLDPAQVGRRLAFYNRQLAGLRALYQSVKSLKSSSQEARKVLKRRLDEMKRMRMDPREYFQAEVDLAKQRGGIFAQQLEDDVAALDDAEQRNQEYQDLYQTIPGIAGNVEGLQTLAQYSHMMSGELAGIRDLMRRSMVDRSEGLQLQEEARQAEAQRRIDEYAAMKAKRQANEQFTNDFRSDLPGVLK